MPVSPNRALLAVFVLLIVFSTLWRRRKIRRARRDLPTPMQRLLGPEPLFAPPTDTPMPDGLRAYAAMYKRTRLVIYFCWSVAALYALLILFLVLKGKLS